MTDEAKHNPHIRPIGPEDRERLAAFFDGLSEESRRRRFLAPKKTLSGAELKFLTDVDHRTHDALVAIDPADGSIVAVARYAAWPDRQHVAEIAFSVADGRQGQGLGTLLGRRLIPRARARGFARLDATTLVDNQPARALLRRLGFVSVGASQGVMELQLCLERPRLTPRHEPLRRAARRGRTASRRRAPSR
jgi:RimJ/RimL family protein N-acetyltransferase